MSLIDSLTNYYCEYECIIQTIHGQVELSAFLFVITLTP